MVEINKITAEPNQEFDIILNNGETVNINVEYKIRVNGWFMSLEYKDKSYKNLHLISSTNNILYQYKNILPFAINIITKTGNDPLFLDDFDNGNNTFNLEDYS